MDVEVPNESEPRAYGGYMPSYTPPPALAPPPVTTVPSTATPTNGDRVCRSPMAGVVFKINVQVGQQIQTDDVLMVLEAMKMETNVTSPLTGQVASIEVAVGDAVQVDQVVVRFE